MVRRVIGFLCGKMAYLGVGPDVLEHARNTAERLVEVVALFQGILDRLSNVSKRITIARIAPTFKTRSYSLPCAWFVFSVAVT
jgi:hypothetical protein